MHVDLMHVLDAETLGKVKLSNLSHDTSFKLIDASGFCTSSNIYIASSNSNTALRLSFPSLSVSTFLKFIFNRKKITEVPLTCGIITKNRAWEHHDP